jgi:hypothetical protein
MTRIGPASGEDDETAHAEHVARWLRHYDGRDIGAHTGRDGDPGVRVDFLYDSTSEPVALEITSICDGPVFALGAQLIRLEREVDLLARDEHLGSWMLGVRTGTRIADLRPLLPEFLRRRAKDGDDPTRYSVEDAPPDLPPDDLRLLVRLLEGGLGSALRTGGGHGVSIFPPVSMATIESGFSTLLRHAIADNAVKLGETRPRETHLLVELGIRVSNDPTHTPPPRLPPAIDVLWVYLGYWNAKFDYRVWRSSRHDPRWQLLDDPVGRPPIWHP